MGLCKRCNKHLTHPNSIICKTCSIEFSECVICQNEIPNQQGKSSVNLGCSTCNSKLTDWFLQQSQ